jgi:hypothetical protein
MEKAFDCREALNTNQAGLCLSRNRDFPGKLKLALRKNHSGPGCFLMPGLIFTKLKAYRPFSKSLKFADSRMIYLIGLAKFVYENYDVDSLVWDSSQKGQIISVYLMFGLRRECEIHHSVIALDDVATRWPY